MEKLHCKPLRSDPAYEWAGVSCDGNVMAVGKQHWGTGDIGAAAVVSNFGVGKLWFVGAMLFDSADGR